MNKILLFICGLFIFPASDVFAQSGYIWPLKLNPELTSKFCDYRAGHFHSGLDIRTQGKIGFRVYAIADGHIYRVVASFRGYGRAVYLKLNDGKIVVYGHLSGFTEKIEERIFAAQMKNRKYYQDIYFSSSEFPVKKGAIIGYSGESGAGAPHLHFELRSPGNNPINPLLSGFKIADKGKPEFHNLAIKYFQEGYLPNGSLENYDRIETIPVKGSATSGFYVADTIICDHQMALSVSGGDRITGAGFLYGFYGLRFWLNDSLIFEMNSDSLSFSSTGQLNYVRDFDLIKLFEKKHKTDNDDNIFYRLYVPPQTRQFFWPANRENAGIVNPSGKAGLREARILALDETGNEITLRFYIREPELAFIRPEEESCFRKNDRIYFVVNTPIRPSAIILENRNSAMQEFKPIRMAMVSKAAVRDEESFCIDTIKAAIPPAETEFRLRYIDSEGRTSPWKYFKESLNSDEFIVNGSPDLLRIEYHSNFIKSIPNVHIRANDVEFSQLMTICGPDIYETIIRNRNITGHLWVGFEDGHNIIFDTSFVLYAAIPGEAGEVISPDSVLNIYLDKSSAYCQSYIFVSQPIRESTPLGPAIIYNIEPENMLFDTPVEFSFDTHRLALAGKKAGVYGASGIGKGWSFISKINGAKLEANGIGLGKVAILEDTEPPQIISISPQGTIQSATPLISCAITDNLSGLELNDGLSMKIDDQWVPAEFDIDSGKFAYKIKNPLKLGKHKLEITVSDNQGNSAARQTHFTVNGKKR